ncbi:MAG: insulinase family protein, partial [Armatimonadota bacterium]|nr:insulinase family protein [Armatimonadota bacterium]
MRRLILKLTPFIVLPTAAVALWARPAPPPPRPITKPASRPTPKPAAPLERPTPAPTLPTLKPAVIKPATPKPTTAKSPSAARPKPPMPQRKTLPNGLTILVLENHAAPVVAVRIYVKTGSIYEGEYLGAGISHLFEHTLSEGTKTRTKQQMHEETQAIGGQENAYTSYDVTAYHMTTASNYFERALNLLADQMQNATFPQSEVETQKGVIHNEMNLDDDDPDRALSELFYATAFRVHPVRFPIIGYRQAFDRLTRDDILNYYKTHYTPENTVVSIAGDVNTDRAMVAVAEAFKNWERRTAHTPAIPDEPLQTTRRRAVVEKNVSLTYLQQGWHTVPIQHPDLYALDVLAQVLGGGESSRLVRQLREKQNLVTSISAFSSTPNYNAGVFGIRATMPPANLAKAGKAIWDEVGKIRAQRITHEELQRAKRQIETTFVFNNSSVEDQAEQMAYDELSTGDPTFSRSYVDRIKVVTRQQVLEAARKYLTGNGFTVAIVRPRGQVDLTPAMQGRAAVLPPQMVLLPNGLRLIVRENHSTPTVAIVAEGLGGARLEPGNKA